MASNAVPAPAVAAQADAKRPQAKALRHQASPHAVLLIVASAMFMEQLDGTVLATALPTMARSFGADPLHMNIALTS